jgi:uncharacterized protein with NAD-binding domain and iron-sulfur cluster
MGMSERRRVAILGGGAGSLAAAFELTATPELREKYDITVYQLGWRCGGKGASGRRTVGGGAERIEEHGLHVWFGFYENAFDVMRRIYEELDRPEGAPLRTWRDAFHPTNEVVLCDDTDDDRWIPRHFHFPPNDGTPGIPTESPSLHRLMHDAIHTLRLVEPPVKSSLQLRALDKFFDGFLLAMEKVLAGDDDSKLADVLEDFLRFAKPILHLGADAEHAEEPLICRFLRLLTDIIWKLTDGDRYAMTFDVTATVFRGILVDDLDDVHKGGFGQVNDEEFMAWMARHGARPETLAESTILRAFYQLCFGYQDGDREQPCIAAGKALQAMLRMCLGYRGAIMWKMQAGMGDAIFAPMYEALTARGVRFEFFTEVTNIGVSPDGQLVDRIGLRRQAKIAAGTDAYNPLLPDPGGLLSWPAEPLYDQLEGGIDVYRDVRFEACQSGPDARDEELEVGKDFDDVVLGMSVASLPPVTQELAAADPKFQAMLDHAMTVATQALQVWMKKPPEELGPENPAGMVSGAYLKPLDTLCDMSHLLPREGWPAGDGVVSLGYLCGTMEQPADDDQDEADQRAFAAGVEHLKTKALVLWPGAEDPNKPGAFDWDLLYDATGSTGEDRVRAQYWRANIFGSERYVLTPPGSIQHRMRPGGATPSNLALAGDWTRNGICGGSVEAAVTSGKLASQHLSGHPAVVPGTEGWLESD